MSEAKKGLLAKIKALFAETVTPVTAEATPTPYKLKDGTEITVAIVGDTISVGDKVTGPDGQPAPAGQWELEDGTMVSTDATGMITEILPAVVTPEEEAATPSVEDRLKALEDKLAAPAAMQEQFAVSENKLADVTKRLALAEAKVIQQDKLIANLIAFAELVSEEPTADPVTLSGLKKERFERVQAGSDRLARRAAARQSLKNTTK